MCIHKYMCILLYDTYKFSSFFMYIYIYICIYIYIYISKFNIRYSICLVNSDLSYLINIIYLNKLYVSVLIYIFNKYFINMYY